MQDSSGAPTAGAASKPFLRRGSGWEARVAAAREGRRYVPRGGPVKDYSKEEEAPLPKRRAASRIPKSPAGARPARAGAGAVGGGARRSAGALAPAPAVPPGGKRLQAAAGSTASAAPSTAFRSSCTSSPAKPAAGWARKLLQGSQAPDRQAAPELEQLGLHKQQPRQQQQPMHGRDARQAHEDAALMEFEALESQVLREVGNSPVQPASGGKKAGGTPFGRDQGPSSWDMQGGIGSAVAAPAAVGGQPPADGSSCQPMGLWAHGPAAELGTVSQEAGRQHVFEDDGWAAMHGSLFAENSQQQAAAAGISHPLARQEVTFRAAQAVPPVAARAARAAAAVPRTSAAAAGGAGQLLLPRVYQEEALEGHEEEMLAESSFVHEPPTSALVQQFFHRPQAPSVAASSQHPQLAPHLNLQSHPQAGAAQQEAVEELQQEVVRLQEERARVSRLRLQLEESASKLEQDKVAFEKRKVEEAARFEAERAEELRKLQRDRRVLEKQSKAILKMPTKQSKEEVQAVEASLMEERRSGRAREARHKLTVERLRQQIVELQDRNGELRAQVEFLEQQRLQHSWGAPGAVASLEMEAAEACSGRGATAAANSTVQHSSTLVASAWRSSSTAARPPSGPNHRRPGGLPAVKVERSSAVGSSGRRQAAPPAQITNPEQQLQQLPQQRQDWGQEKDAEEDDLQLYADVQLSEEEVVIVCEDEGEDPAADYRSSCAQGNSTTAWPAAASLQQDAAQQPAGQLGQPLPPPPQPPVAAAGAAVGAELDAMAKASSALARFNQLRQSLAEHQSRLGSRSASLASSPQPGAPLAAFNTSSSAVAAPPAAGLSPSQSAPASAEAEDDLRRLGRSMLAASGQAAPCMAGMPLAAATLAEHQQQQAGAVNTTNDVVVSELQHPDGRWELLYSSGMREQRFSNGSLKQVLPSGASLTRFANGDIKKVLPCGTVEYFYAEVSSWQVTHASGVDVFFFPSGQVEAHHPGGIKEILFADGAVRKVLPDGRELTISAAHLSSEIQMPQPLPDLC